MRQHQAEQHERHYSQRAHPRGQHKPFRRRLLPGMLHKKSQQQSNQVRLRPHWRVCVDIFPKESYFIETAATLIR